VVLPYCCATQYLSRNLATRGPTRNEGRGGKTRQCSATVVQLCSLRFLIFITSRMGQLHHTAPSSRLFVPNSLTVCHLSFLRGCACNITFMWVGSFRSDPSPTATSAPSLDQLILNGSLISYQQVRINTVVQILHLYYLTQHNHAKFSPFSHLFCSTQSS
jgi:hypothetical protein